MKPFLSPLIWSCIIAILFHPLHSFFLKKFKNRKNTAALATILFVLLIIVLPAVLIATTLVNQGVDFYKQLESQEVDPRQFIDRLIQLFPQAEHFLAKFNIDPDDLKEQFAKFSINSAEFISKNIFSFGQNTLQFFVNLALFSYVSFFFIKDGPLISERILNSIPLSAERSQLLLCKFREVTRATIKGNFVIAGIQGTLGGIIFAVLGLPAALIFIVSGELIKGIVLIAFGVLIIGLIDNILRPILIGKDTKLPDYLVLLSTLGGLTLLGINGFVLGPLVAALFVTMWCLFEQDAEAVSENT